MSQENSLNRNSANEQVSKQSLRLDGLDGTLDGSIDVGKTPEQKAEIKRVMQDRVNTVQGTIRQAFRKAEVKKDLRSPHWRKFETVALDTQTDLIRRLAKFDVVKLQVEQEVADFDNEIAEFLNTLDTAEEQYQGLSETKEKEVKSPPPSVDSIFAELGRPLITTEERKHVTENFGEENVRKLYTAIKLYEKIPVPIQQRIFKRGAIDTKQIAAQMLTNTFDQFRALKDGPAFLLDHPENAVYRVREEEYDRIARHGRDVGKAEMRIKEFIRKLDVTVNEKQIDEFSLTGFVGWLRNVNLNERGQELLFKEIRKVSTEQGKVQEKINQANLTIQALNLALVSFDATELRNAGNSIEADRTILRVREDLGKDTLKKLEEGLTPGDTELSDESDKILKDPLRNRQLTAFDQQLFFGSHEEALKIAIQEHSKIDRGTVRLIDGSVDLQIIGKDIFQRPGALFGPKPEDPAARFLQSSNKRFISLKSQKRVGRGQESFDPFGMLKQQPQEGVRVLQSLGKLPDGNGELILIEALKPGKDGSREEDYTRAIALRDENGTVRLQDGTVVKEKLDGASESLLRLPDGITVTRPREVKPIDITLRRGGYDLPQRIYLSQKAEKSLRSTDFSKTRSVLRGVPKRTFVTPGLPPIYTLTSKDLEQARNENGNLTLFDGDGKLKQTIDFAGFQKDRTEKSRNVLRAIDTNPAFKEISQKGAGVQQNMENIKALLQAGTKSTSLKADVYVDYVREQAMPIKALLDDQSLKQKVSYMKGILLEELKNLDTSDASGSSIEGEIRRRIDALEGFAETLSDQSLYSSIDFVTDASKFKPDTWEEWRKGDGIIMLAAIIAAVVAIGILTVATGGAAGLIAVSTLGAFSGIVGGELASEGLHLYHKKTGVKRGEYTYSRRSRLGAYTEGQKVFDPVKGEYVDLSFVGDVVLPYARDFIVGTITTAAAMGAGRAIGGLLSKLAQNSKFIQGLAKHSSIANSILKRMSHLAKHGAKVPKSAKEFLRNNLAEIFDEIGDEIAEGAVGAGLAQIDERLRFLGVLIVASGKGFRPLGGGTLGYNASTNIAAGKQAVLDWVREEGHSVASVSKDDVFDIKTFDGQTLLLQPDVKASLETLNASEGTIEQQLEDNPALKKDFNATAKKLKKIPELKGVDLRSNSPLAQALFKAHRIAPTGTETDPETGVTREVYSEKDIAQKTQVVKEAIDADPILSKLSPKQKRALRAKLIRGKTAVLGNEQFYRTDGDAEGIATLELEETEAKSAAKEAMVEEQESQQKFDSAPAVIKKVKTKFQNLTSEQEIKNAVNIFNKEASNLEPSIAGARVLSTDNLIVRFNAKGKLEIIKRKSPLNPLLIARNPLRYAMGVSQKLGVQIPGLRESIYNGVVELEPMKNKDGKKTYVRRHLASSLDKNFQAMDIQKGMAQMTSRDELIKLKKKGYTHIISRPSTKNLRRTFTDSKLRKKYSQEGFSKLSKNEAIKMGLMSENPKQQARIDTQDTAALKAKKFEGRLTKDDRILPAEEREFWVLDIDSALKIAESTTEAERQQTLANLTAQGKKTNVLSLSAEEEAMLRQQTLDRYRTMDSVKDAKAQLDTLIEKKFPGEAAKLKNLTEQVMSLYFNTDQYHNAEHMLTMTNDIFTLANKGQLDPATYKRLLLSGIYHDAGNGLHPDTQAGQDEGDAAALFLRDVKNAAKDSPLSNLSNDDKIQVTANILGTVFADRHADASRLAGKDYVKRGVELLADQGIEVTPGQLAERMVTAEALTVRNADVLGSLRKENVIINNFKNLHEDTRKDLAILSKSDHPDAKILYERIQANDIDAFELREFVRERAGDFTFPKFVALGKLPTQYRNGFKAFLSGEFHKWRNPKIGPDGKPVKVNDVPLPSETGFFKEAQQGKYLLDTQENIDAANGQRTEVQRHGQQVEGDADIFNQQLDALDGPILIAMQDLVTNDALQGQENLLKLKLSELAPRLEQAMGENAFAPYKKAFNAAINKNPEISISQMSATELNQIFALMTLRAKAQGDNFDTIPVNRDPAKAPLLATLAETTKAATGDTKTTLQAILAESRSIETKNLQEQTFTETTIIITEGTNNSQIFVLVEGTAEIMKTDVTGKETVIATITAPATVGGITAFNPDAKATATVRVTAGAKVIAVNAEALNADGITAKALEAETAAQLVSQVEAVRKQQNQNTALETKLESGELTYEQVTEQLQDAEVVEKTFNGLLKSKTEQINKTVKGEGTLEEKVARKLGLPTKTLSVEQKRAILLAHYVGAAEGTTVGGFNKNQGAQKRFKLTGRTQEGGLRRENPIFNTDQQNVLLNELQLAGVATAPVLGGIKIADNAIPVTFRGREGQIIGKGKRAGEETMFLVAETEDTRGNKDRGNRGSMRISTAPRSRIELENEDFGTNESQESPKQQEKTPEKPDDLTLDKATQLAKSVRYANTEKQATTARKALQDFLKRKKIKVKTLQDIGGDPETKVGTILEALNLTETTKNGTEAVQQTATEYPQTSAELIASLNSKQDGGVFFVPQKDGRPPLKTTISRIAGRETVFTQNGVQYVQLSYKGELGKYRLARLLELNQKYGKGPESTQQTETTALASPKPYTKLTSPEQKRAALQKGNEVQLLMDNADAPITKQKNGKVLKKHNIKTFVESNDGKFVSFNINGEIKSFPIGKAMRMVQYTVDTSILEASLETQDTTRAKKVPSRLQTTLKNFSDQAKDAGITTFTDDEYIYEFKKNGSLYVQKKSASANVDAESTSVASIDTDGRIHYAESKPLTAEQAAVVDTDKPLTVTQVTKALQAAIAKGPVQTETVSSQSTPDSPGTLTVEGLDFGQKITLYTISKDGTRATQKAKVLGKGQGFTTLEFTQKAKDGTIIKRTQQNISHKQLNRLLKPHDNQG